MDFKPGTITLVGGGPGDPELITVAGLKALRAADVILYDRLAPIGALDECKPECELIEVGKIPRGRFTSQDKINQLLISHAQAGKVVVRLKGGDPFVFGRGGEEYQAATAQGIQVQVIPGISSAIAAGELAGIPVTHRGLTQGFTVVSGHVPPNDERCSIEWTALAKGNTTIVILMGVKFLPQILAELQLGGMDPYTPAAIISDAAGENFSTIYGDISTIDSLAEAAGVQPPAVTIIGLVAQEGLLSMGD